MVVLKGAKVCGVYEILHSSTSALAFYIHDDEHLRERLLPSIAFAFGLALANVCVYMYVCMCCC